MKYSSSGSRLPGIILEVALPDSGKCDTSISSVSTATTGALGEDSFDDRGSTSTGFASIYSIGSGDCKKLARDGDLSSLAASTSYFSY